MLLQGKIAVITGSGRGIGREIALAYAREGAKLVLAARSVPELEETRNAITAMGGEASVVPTDIRNEQSVAALAQQTLEHFSRVDILVNNSGIAGPTAPLWEIAPAEWEETFAVNVTGTFLCCRAFLPSMIATVLGLYCHNRLYDWQATSAGAHSLRGEQDGACGTRTYIGLGGRTVRYSGECDIAGASRGRTH